MKLSEKQREFAHDFNRLLSYIYNTTKLQITLGEVHRPRWVQEIYFKQGKSSLKSGHHQRKLAVDLFLWKDGKILWSGPEYEKAGEFWESIGGKWGGRWRKPFDPYHFQSGRTR